MHPSNRAVVISFVALAACTQGAADQGIPRPDSSSKPSRPPPHVQHVPGLDIRLIPPPPDPVASFASMPGACSADGWCWRKPSPQGNALHAMYETGDHLWIVGARRTVLHWDGKAWDAPVLPEAPREDFESVFGTSESDVWATTLKRIYHWDGAAWVVSHAIPDPVDMRLHRGYAAAPDDAWVPGDYGVVFHWDGTAWTQLQSATGSEIFTTWGSAGSDVWFGGKAGALVHWDGMGFTAHDSGTLTSIERIWGASKDDVWAVGLDGLALHWAGDAWTEVDSGTTNYINAVHGTSSDDVWFSGMAGRVGHWDGAAWTTTQISDDAGLFEIHAMADGASVWTLGRKGELYVHDAEGWTPIVKSEDIENQAMWAADAFNIFRVGPGAIYRYDGAAWIKEDAGTLFGLNAVHGRSIDDVWVVGQLGKVHHFDGRGWKTTSLGSGVWLNGVWVRSDGTAFAVGDGGMLYLLDYDGQWKPVDSGVTSNLFGIWGPADDLAWAVGSEGTILRWDGSVWAPQASPTLAELRAVHGSADGAVWIVGSNATALRLTNDAFTEIPIPALDLRGVSVKSANQAYAVGTVGDIFEWDGTSWRLEESGTVETMNAVIAIDGGSAWAAANGGVLLERP